MSKFTKFMKANKVIKENEKFAPTKSLLDDKGVPLEWEFRHVSSKENEKLKDSCTTEVQVTGKPNSYKQKVDVSRYVAELIVASTVFPDLYDAELQDSYGVKTPEDLLFSLVDAPGEYAVLGAWIQRFQGFDESLEEKVSQAKN